MKQALTILLIILSFKITAQSKYSPIVGGIEFGIGYSSIIDLNRGNNIKYNKDLSLEQLFLLSQFIPFQFGFVSAKYLDSFRYVEIGLIYRKSSVGWIDLHPSGHGWGIPGINFYSVDIPVKYYFPTRIHKSYTNAYFGLIPSWLVKVDVIRNDAYEDIPEEYFRNAYVSLCGGICRDRKHMRFKIHTSLAITSVINSSYRNDILREDRAYGGIILPFELLACWAYILE